MYSAKLLLPVFSLVLTVSSAPVQQQSTMKLVKSLIKPMMGAPSPIAKPVLSPVVNPIHSSVPVSSFQHPSSIHPSSIHPSSIHPSSIHPSSIHPSSIHPSSIESLPMISPQYPFPLVHHGDISSDIQLSPSQSHLSNGIVYDGLPPTVMTGIQSDLPILVDGQVASLGTSMGGNLPIVKEVSMTDKMFPWYKKVRTSIASGTSKIRSILPGNPLRKLFGRNEDEIISEDYVRQEDHVGHKEHVRHQEHVRHEETPTIPKEKTDILSEAKRAVVKAAEVGAAKLTKYVGENNKNLVGPSSLVASVKVKHPMIGKQSAKVKLSTV